MCILNGWQQHANQAHPGKLICPSKMMVGRRALFREHVCVFRGITLLLGMMFSTSTLYTSWCLGRLVSFAEPWKGDMFLDKDFCSFHHENWGRFPIWLLFCQMGWNHQQVVIKEKTNSSILALGFKTYKNPKNESIYCWKICFPNKMLPPLEVAAVHDSKGRLRAEALIWGAPNMDLGSTPTSCKWGGYGAPINGRK